MGALSKLDLRGGSTADVVPPQYWTRGNLGGEAAGDKVLCVGVNCTLGGDMELTSGFQEPDDVFCFGEEGELFSAAGLLALLELGVLFFEFGPTTAGELFCELGSLFPLGTGIGLDLGIGGTTTNPAVSGDDGAFSSSVGDAEGPPTTVLGTDTGAVARKG